MIVFLDTYFIMSTDLFIWVFNNVFFKTIKSVKIETVLLTIVSPIFSKQYGIEQEFNHFRKGKQEGIQEGRKENIK